MESKEIESLADIFKSLAHPVRLRIAFGLAQKDYCNVSTMVENLGISQPNVSQHLNILKNAGVIEGYREGNTICYKLVNKKVREILNCLKKSKCSS